jgi:hypothetical protein
MCAAHVFAFRVDSDRQVMPVVARLVLQGFDFARPTEA